MTQHQHCPDRSVALQKEAGPVPLVAVPAAVGSASDSPLTASGFAAVVPRSLSASGSGTVRVADSSDSPLTASGFAAASEPAETPGEECPAVSLLAPQM